MLTDKKVKSLKPKKSPYYEREKSGGRGMGRLVVQVLPSGTKNYHFQFYKNGKPHFLKIGTTLTHTLSAARQKAMEYSKLLVDGKNPKTYIEEVRKSEKESFELEKLKSSRGTLQELFIDYTNNMKINGKRTYQAVLDSLTKEFGSLLQLPACEVSTLQISEVLASMIKRGAVVQSNRVRSYAMTAFNFGIRYDFDPMYAGREQKYHIANNPVANIPRQQGAEKVRERTLTEKELFELFQDMPNIGFSIEMECLIKLLFLTGGQRPYEIITLKWENIDFDNSLLEISSDYSKNKKAHIVPLVSNALEVFKFLKSISQDSDYVFSKRGKPQEHIPTTSLAQAIRRYCDREKIERFQPKDIRRTCKTIMGQLGISKSTRDRLQNHALQDVSSKHYDRYDYLREKRSALNKWAQYLQIQNLDVTFTLRS